MCYSLKTSFKKEGVITHEYAGIVPTINGCEDFNDKSPLARSIQNYHKQVIRELRKKGKKPINIVTIIDE